jgi:hypothetical protein
MSVYSTSGSFPFKAPDGQEYLIQYSAQLHFGDDERRGDVVEVEPSSGEEIPLFGEWHDSIVEAATDEAYKKYHSGS